MLQNVTCRNGYIHFLGLHDIQNEIRWMDGSPSDASGKFQIFERLTMNWIK